MITHLFYHQEAVEELCALNSWRSIQPAIAPRDEVIFLDLGRTLSPTFPIDIDCKFLRLERVRTDVPEERSYTFGLNMLMPAARNEWIVLWRSDYIYHRRYFPALRQKLMNAEVVVPYECIVGAEYAGDAWCRDHFDFLTTAPEDELLQHASVCATWESCDFPHFAIKRDFWIRAQGMDPRLFGYGWQFPEFFSRLEKLPNVRFETSFDLLAFHQNHRGSFGLGNYTPDKAKELWAGELKFRDVMGRKEAAEAFKKRKRTPLRPRWPDDFYKPKTNQSVATPA